MAILLGYYDIWLTQHDLIDAMDGLADLIDLYDLSARIYLVRYATVNSSDAVRWLLAEGIPVIVGQRLDSENSTWHYRVVHGYDDKSLTFVVDDPYYGPNYQIPYETFDLLAEGNGTIIPVYPKAKDGLIHSTMSTWQMKLIVYP
jgi:hypothetical protein